MKLKIFLFSGIPIGGVFSPFFQCGYVALFDIAGTQGDVKHDSIVGQCDQRHLGVLECLLGDGEAVCIGGYHADDFTSVAADCFYSLQAA